MPVTLDEIFAEMLLTLKHMDHTTNCFTTKFICFREGNSKSQNEQPGHNSFNRAPVKKMVIESHHWCIQNVELQ